MMRPHLFAVRVYYEDTDAGGVVYHANYLRFAERARTEMMRAAGLDHRTLLEESGVIIAVRRCEADYLAPAMLDDALEIESRVLGVRGATFEIEQVVRRDGRDLARLLVMLVCLTRDGRATRLPQRLRTLFGAGATDQPQKAEARQ